MQRLLPAAQLPRYAHTGPYGDLAADLFAAETATLAPIGEPGSTVAVRTGLALELPSSHGALVEDRSGLALRGVTTLAGVIDPGYRGELRVVLTNLGNEPQTVAPGTGSHNFASSNASRRPSKRRTRSPRRRADRAASVRREPIPPPPTPTPPASNVRVRWMGEIIVAAASVEGTYDVEARPTKKNARRIRAFSFCRLSWLAVTVSPPPDSDCRRHGAAGAGPDAPAAAVPAGELAEPAGFQRAELPCAAAAAVAADSPSAAEVAAPDGLRERCSTDAAAVAACSIRSAWLWLRMILVPRWLHSAAVVVAHDSQTSALQRSAAAAPDGSQHEELPRSAADAHRSPYARSCTHHSVGRPALRLPDRAAAPPREAPERLRGSLQPDAMQTPSRDAHGSGYRTVNGSARLPPASASEPAGPPHDRPHASPLPQSDEAAH